MSKQSRILSGWTPGAARWARRLLPQLDASHLGLVLRTLLWTQACIAVLALFQHPPSGWTAPSGAGSTAWLACWSLINAVVLPLVLLWLLLVCSLLPSLWQRAAPVLSWLGVLAGALLGAVAAWLWQGLWLGQREAPWLAAVCAGALAGLALTRGLLLRARSRQPLQAQARIAELQARIRPHFLFNTLNSALALLRSQPQRAEQVLEDLSELLRAALTASDPASTLADELALARMYLDIEQLRFGARMRVHWALDPATFAVRLPPLLLQPLLENAVRHAVECSLAPVDLQIIARRESERVCVQIVNSLPASIAARRDGQGLALANVRARLHLLHDWACSFEAGRVGARGSAPARFVVTLRLPLAADAAP
jgi:two-component system sensor histidine kinase AlgZ